MINFKLFLFISFFIYFVVFYIAQKIKIPYITKILFLSFIGGSYYNIAHNAEISSVVNKLNIIYTPEIGFISGFMTFLYIVTAIFYLKDDRYKS